MGPWAEEAIPRYCSTKCILVVRGLVATDLLETYYGMIGGHDAQALVGLCFGSRRGGPHKILHRLPGTYLDRKPASPQVGRR